jgi:SNF2 family DNA or RNA helicase
LVITTYGLLPSFAEEMSGHKDAWDYIVLDEAQIIKNAKTKVAANVRAIAEAGVQTRRLILSGTPIMNNLSELWALMDFACSGKILGPELRLVLNLGRELFTSWH